MTSDEISMVDLILKIITSVTALAAAIAGAVKYFRERRHEMELRREELAWRKTEFVFQLSQHFDNDENIQAALRLIEYGSSSVLKDALNSPLPTLTPEQVTIRYQVERYLDFLDRLCQFVCITETLTPTDASCFTWYIRRVGQYDVLTEYAKMNGYNDLLMLYARFQSLFQTEEINGANP